jgi:hypothetical protein
MAARARSGGADGTLGQINYLDRSVPSSLYRNGRVFSRRREDGDTTHIEGIVLEKREVTVWNARGLEGSQRRTLARHGFELLARPLERSGLDFLDHQEVVRDYYRECERVVREATGAQQVFPFDHNVRSAAGMRGQRTIKGGQRVQGPAHLAHGDYTLASAPTRMRDLTKPPSLNDTLRGVLEPGRSLLAPELVDRALAEGGRFAIINLWRSIADEPVATHPLALCDAQTVAPEDLVVFELRYPDRVGENYFSKYSPRHEWYSYPAMRREEALLIKQWDSAGPLARSGGQRGDADDSDAPCTFSFHTAFADPSTPPAAPERWSIEVRCIAVYA